MKKTLRILALVLSLALAAALFGACCKAGTKASLEKKLIGKWAADLSALSELIGEETEGKPNGLIQMWNRLTKGKYNEKNERHDKTV